LLTHRTEFCRAHFGEFYAILLFRQLSLDALSLDIVSDAPLAKDDLLVQRHGSLPDLDLIEDLSASRNRPWQFFCDPAGL